MKRLVLLAVACATAVVLWVAAAGAAQNGSGGPLAKSAAVTTRHIPLSKAGDAMPRGLKGLPAKGDYAFLLKLKAEPTGVAFDAFRNLGKSAARVAAENQFATVRATESRVIAALPSDSRVLYRMHAIMAGVAVYTSVKNLPALQRISGVKTVYAIAPKKPSLSYSVYLEKAPQVWQSLGDTGNGTSIAIIDTGVDYTHADFGGPGTPAAYQTALANDTSAPSYPDTNKISTESFDLVGDAYDASSSTPADTIPHPDPNPLDCNSHGTHTSGDAAGYGEDTTGTKFAGDYKTLGSLTSSQYQATFKIGPGMAPEAKLFEYKVFGCNGSTDVVADALDRAADPNQDGSTNDHVDVVSMSLGSDFGSPQDGDAVASNAASALGISVVAASGNGGDLYDVGGSPGDARDAIAVAASVDAYSQLDTLHVSGPAPVVGPYPAERSVAYDWAHDLDLSGTVATLTDPGDLNNQDGCDPISTDLTGKIAWLEWTDNDANRRCGSVARSANAEAAGAIGAIFADDEDSFAAGITGSADKPVVMVNKAAGDALRADAQAGTLTVGSTSANDFEQDLPQLDDEVAGFSSRGIRIAGDVKPDVSAVGVSVFSAGMGTGSDGLSDSGTSMATPEVAGLDALVRNQNSGWNPEEVKADIMNTADQDLFAGDSHTGDTFAPNRVGAGRIDAQAALANKVLAYVSDDPGAVSASFGTIEATGPMTLHKTIQVVNKDLVNPSATYDVTYDALTQVPGATYSVSPSTVTLAAGETKTVTLTLTIDRTQLTKTHDPTLDTAPDGFPGDFLADASGRVLFTPNPADPSIPTLRVPVYSAPRPASVMTQPATLGMPSGSVQTASLPLSGTGVDQGVANPNVPDPTLVQSIVAGFELQAKSGALTGIPSDEKAADLKYVGTTSDAPELASVGDNSLDPNCNPDGQCGLEYFAISTQGPWHTAATQNEYDIYIDSNGDGTPDFVTFNTRLSASDDVMVDETVDLNTDDIVDVELINDRFGNTDTALFDSDTLVMPVFIPALTGVSAGHSRITYAIATFGQFSTSPVDQIGFGTGANFFDGSLSTDVLNPGLAIFGSFDGNEDPLLYADMPSTSLTVRRDAASYAADNGMGALLVHFHNKAGNKAQIVDLGHTLTVAKNGTGTGTVTSSPAGINCGAGCVGSFATGASVTLTATAAAGSAFTGWSGGSCSGTGTCHVTLNGDAKVTATFTPTVALSVSKAGNGFGTVTSSPAGIDCGSTCSAPFAIGTSVMLTAHAGSGSTFGGWSGGGCSGTGACHMTVNAATSVTATFRKKEDKTKPKVTSVKVKVNHGKRTAEVTFRGTDPGHGSKGLRFKCKLDKKSFKSCRSPKLYKHLSHGKHTVQVKAIDKAGNVSKAVKKKFTV
jgi:subtilisin family serine protease